MRRTWGILEGGDANTRVWAYGPHFQYEEFMQTPGPISAIVTSLVIYFGFGLLVSFAILSRLVSWWCTEWCLGRAGFLCAC